MEKITNIEIKNFKSIRHAEIKDCRKVNVFIGPPNVGKSNILEGLSGLVYEHSNQIDFNKFCRYEYTSELFFDGNYEQNAILEINSKYLLTYSFTDNSDLNIRFKEFRSDSMDIYNGEMVDLESSQFTMSFRNGKSGSSSRSINQKPIFSVKRYIHNLNANPNSNNTLFLDVPFGNNLINILQKDMLLRKEIVELFRTYNLKLIIDKIDQTIKFQKELSDGTALNIRYNLIADTLQRLIFFKAAILSNENSVLLFEEPEANCYEPYIMEITNAIKNDEKNNQFFIVTHSQYVIDELLRDKESRENVNIYLVGLDNNETKVKLLQPDVSEDVYQSGLNVFFNFKSLWDEN